MTTKLKNAKKQRKNLPRLDDAERGRITALYHDAKWKIERIEKLTGRSPNTISQIARGLARRTDSVKRSSSNKQRGLSKKQKAIKERRAILVVIVKAVERKKGRVEPKFGSCRQVALEYQRRTAKRISDELVRLDLLREGFRSYVRPLITFNKPKVHDDRVKWVKLMLKNHTTAYFRRIVFTDEHFVDANHHGNRSMWCRCRDDALSRLRMSRFNVPSIMIWAGIGHNFKTPIIFLDLGKDDDGKTRRMNAESYKRHCLTPELRARLRNENRVLMQDGARCHTAKTVMEFLETHRVAVLHGWPAHSPDMNPIEAMWAYLDALVCARGPVDNVEELRANIVAAWDSIPQPTINNFASMFEDRLEAVKKQRLQR